MTGEIGSQLAVGATRVQTRPSRRSLARRLLLLACTAAFSASGAGVARAELTITKPFKGASINTQTPTFEGTTTDVYNPLLETFDPVTVKIYQGTNTEGSLVQEPKTPLFAGNEWSLPVERSLNPGTYTAQAVQPSEKGEQKSEPVTFTINTTAPAVSITAPANGSSATGETQTVAGLASTSGGAKRAVTVSLYAGSALSTTPVVELTVQRSETDGSWSAPFGGLKPGTYTVQAVQRDSSGNIGRSAEVTFTMVAPSPPGPPASPPSASFTWFPASPAAGQNVALVSNSTDAFSPISAFAWDLAGSGPFKPAGPLLTTSFPTPGNHVVRLQVTDARGATSIATKTIAVGAAPLTLMQPFPIVRIAGNQSSLGVTISLLTIQAPVGAHVSLSCRGKGCSKRSLTRVAAASSHSGGSSSAVVAFRRPEHRLRAGAVLEIRVSKPGQIGKYTRFTIHRRRLPTREDSCLSALDPRPIACPA